MVVSLNCDDDFVEYYFLKSGMSWIDLGLRPIVWAIRASIGFTSSTFVDFETRSVSIPEYEPDSGHALNI